MKKFFALLCLFLFVCYTALPCLASDPLLNSLLPEHGEAEHDGRQGAPAPPAEESGTAVPIAVAVLVAISLFVAILYILRGRRRGED